ncbi:PspA/IM30 family protein [Lederbergia citrea]|uniref:PspA/IM30 family protein n=1 Tax=Lederbergia citrea TaxID=2833581 RepID=UPI001BC99DB9|nr:PspA/IM30 family protein [Lederbergia citrea]MBS4203948.1 PspA/IM30 family protein [Lederbergia citrea]
MNNLLEKIKQSIAADFNEVTTTHKERKQNPISLLNKYVRESEGEVEKAAKLIERQRMLKNELNKEMKLAQTLADKRKEQGRLAIAAGADELAEIALHYQAQAEQQVERLQRSYETALQQLSDLEMKFEEMKLKVKDMHIKRLELMGRENVLSMKEKMNKILDESEFGNAAENFENIETTMKQQETNMDDKYEITVFDAKIQQLAKEINNEEKLKAANENVIQ